MLCNKQECYCKQNNIIFMVEYSFALRKAQQRLSLEIVGEKRVIAETFRTVLGGVAKILRTFWRSRGDQLLLEIAVKTISFWNICGGNFLPLFPSSNPVLPRLVYGPTTHRDKWRFVISTFSRGEGKVTNLLRGSSRRLFEQFTEGSLKFCWIF